MTETIANDVREFVISNFLFGQDDGRVTRDLSFLESGTIDSTGMLELVAFIEEKYGISIGDRELVPENLDSVSNVSRFVARKLEAEKAQVGS